MVNLPNSSLSIVVNTVLRGKWLFLLPALVLVIERTSAQDFFHPGTTAATTARAGIYQPQQENVQDAIALNPAGLAALTSISANAVLMSGLARGTFINAANGATTGDPRLALRPALGLFGAVGSPLGHSRWTAGAALTPDFLSSVHWHYTDTPGTGGADYGSQQDRSELSVIRGAGGLAYALRPTVSLGISAGAVYDQNTLVAPYIFQSNPALQGLKTLLSLHTRGFGWGGSVGIMARPSPRFTLAAAYSSPYRVHSHGHATGSLAERFAVLGIPFTPGFAYTAHVGVKLPQSAFASIQWQITPLFSWSVQGDYADFRTAFKSLPVSLSNGNNPDINAFLASSAIQDEIPLKWSDQYTLRTGVDFQFHRGFQWTAGLAARSNLVPQGTLTPLTGAIMRNTVSTGLQYKRERCLVAAAYANDWNHSERVGTSTLLAGEYSHSRLDVGSQSLTVGLSCLLPGRTPGQRHP